MKALSYTAGPEDEGKLLRELLREDLKISRRLLSCLKRVEGGILVNGHERTVRYSVRDGDLIELSGLDDRPGTDIPPEEGPLLILYEDAHCLIVNKAVGQIMYPRFKGEQGSLAARVLRYLQPKQEEVTFHPIGRLDKNTSGLVLLAKNSFAAGFLQKHVHGKFYLAWAYGKIKSPGVIDYPITKRLQGKPGLGAMMLSKKGLEAKTSYWPLLWDEKRHCSLILLQLHSGRRHQIRLHMSHIGHPLKGDRAYGGPGDGGQALWCVGLDLMLPAGNRLLKIRHLPSDDPRLKGLALENIIAHLSKAQEKGDSHVRSYAPILRSDHQALK